MQELIQDFLVMEGGDGGGVCVNGCGVCEWGWGVCEWVWGV